MTRFARVGGPNASSKRTYEEATPWEAMKADMPKPAKRQKKKKEKPTENKMELSAHISEDAIPIGDDYKAFKIDMPARMKSSKDASVQKRKKVKKNKKLSFEEKKKNYISEDGKKFKVLKTGEKKPWFDLPYEENEVMTRYKNFYVKKEMVPKLDEFKKTLEKQGLDDKKISRVMLRKESKVHNQLRVELLREEIAKNKNVDESIPGEKGVNKPASENLKKNKQSENQKKNRPRQSENQKTNMQSENQDTNMQSENQNITKPMQSFIKFEENDIMTQFEGYWVLKENVESLKLFCEKMKDDIIKDRTDGNADLDLTPEEEIKYRRSTKKEKKQQNKLMKRTVRQVREMNLENQRQDGSPKMESQEKGGQGRAPLNSNELQSVKFDGFYVKKEAAKRLTEIRENMVAKGCSEEEIERVIKMERRQEEKFLKRARFIFCYKCRKVGHRIAACPEGGDSTVEICFKCGSTEHMARKCTSSKDSVYSYATCYVCRKVGHISRECPDNSKGLYPNGGCCNECGSIQHLKKNCPELQKSSENNSLKAFVYRQGQDADSLDEDLVVVTEPQKHKAAEKKIIQFAD